MKKSMIIGFMLFFLNTANALCKAPSPHDLSLHLDKNETYLQQLFQYHQCLKTRFQKIFTPDFQKKLKEQQILLSLLNDKIKERQHQEQDIIKGKWSYRILLTTEQEKMIEKDRLQFQKDKANMAQK